MKLPAIGGVSSKLHKQDLLVNYSSASRRTRESIHLRFEDHSILDLLIRLSDIG